MKHKTYHTALGITPQQVEALPRVSRDLQLIMAEKKEKGLPADPYYYMEACADGGIRKILALRSSFKYKQKKEIPLEAFCAALEVDPISVLNHILATADRLQNYLTTSRLSNHKKDVAQALIDAAIAPEGSEDRRLFMQATGMLPQPKGAQTLIQVTQNANQSAPVAIVAPPPEKTIRTLSDQLSKLMLPSKVEEADVFESEDPTEA